MMAAQLHAKSAVSLATRPDTLSYRSNQYQQVSLWKKLILW
jgi:hypothetical protein